MHTLVLVLLGAIHSVCAHRPTESLSVQRVDANIVTLEFDFYATSDTIKVPRNNKTSGKQQHFGQFPREIGWLAAGDIGVRNMSLVFTQGRPLVDNGGRSRVLTSAPHMLEAAQAPPGVQLAASFDVSSGAVESKWTNLVHVLSGQFCASLNFMDETRVSRPRMSFGDVLPGHGTSLTNGNLKIPATALLYATLPREIVCTENLTPWLKLLPCKSAAGLASLLDAYKLFNANYHSMAVHMEVLCLDGKCTQRQIKLRQSLVIHLDTTRSLGKILPSEWSLESLLGRRVSKPCRVCESSIVRLLDTDGVTITNYDMASIDRDELVFNTTTQSVANTDRESIVIDRWLAGRGEEHGGLSVFIRNNGATTVRLTYMEVLPWYMRLYMHTLQCTVGYGVDRDSADVKPLLPVKFNFQPGVERGRGSALEMALDVPGGGGTVQISYLFDKTLLRYTEYPPDANRGFDIGAAMFTLNESNNRMYSQTLLMTLPAPDFSMPYNVITLTGTVIALFFGGVYNMMMRSFSVADGVPTGLRGLLVRLVRRLKRR